MICKNCGAQMEDTLEKCPYCGYINMVIATKQHDKMIELLRKDRREVLKEPKKAYHHGIKKAIRIVCVTLVVIFLVFGYELTLLWKEIKKDPLFDKRGKHSVEELAYQKATFPRLDQALEKQDIAELNEIYREAEEKGYSIYPYEHYDIVFAAYCYDELVNGYLSEYESGDCGIYRYGDLTYYAFYFYYAPYERDSYQWIFEEFREDIVNRLVLDEMEYTKEELTQLQKKVYPDRNVVRSTCEWVGYRHYFKDR